MVEIWMIVITKMMVLIV